MYLEAPNQFSGQAGARQILTTTQPRRSSANNYQECHQVLWHTDIFTLYSCPPLVVTLHRIVAGWSWRAPFFFFPFTTADSSTLQPPASKSTATIALNRYHRKEWGKS